MLSSFTKLSTPRLVIAATALIVVYFLVSGSCEAVRSQQLRQQRSRLEADIAVLQERHQRLDALRQYLSSDEYIEAVAREQLGLVRPGEKGFVVISTAPSPTPEPGQPAPPDGGGEPGLWWEVLIR